ncbi:hypothetical protein R6Q59_033624 [Mikania micrantha]
MYTLKDSYNLWDLLNQSPVWQDRIFHVLAGLYGVVAGVALVQLIRIQQRVPEYGWTTQKVFHFLNFLVNGARCLIFVFRRDVEQLTPEIAQHMLLDLPSLARAISTDGLRPSFFAINGIVYAIQVGYVTTICFACFLVRCIMMCFNAFNKAANLDILEHPVLNFIYYLLV